MGSKASKFRSSDVAKTMRGVTAGGGQIRQLTVDADGKITVEMGTPSDDAGDDKGHLWKKRLKDLDRG